ncbi:hypothetical protein DL766_008001 [Monosporascus sp. MC13-8B]|uniref:Defect at low temperature protein 1 n=1 Tax=Monosporascus cannonballus TaxID=155416 RepID=A0ABY0H0Q5_9PEZI|nr:hypothetical protein DL762_006919 [Monosporascus cannonballus]RYO85365.1 hypothetical protein DL763_007125 [Monosporascus cannonballus]RYP21165.1 hypothetical protein DL766_008001 [Monosporascus sp. MC13-8B]
MIAANFGTNAVIAWEARPEVVRSKAETLETVVESTDVHRVEISLPPNRSTRDHIGRDGWGSPGSADLPDIEYAQVLAELPSLIELKVVSPAPQDAGVASDTLALDPDAVVLLQRAAITSDTWWTWECYRPMKISNGNPNGPSCRSF